ncbi:MAG: hypothetical protein K2N87_19180 [Eubacterium sp.]|nr:hypothetical protein [Eubacterium sp.]
MSERLTWKQIQEKYPDQWVGLVDIRWRNDSNIDSAVVRYTDKSKEELLMMQINNEIFSCYTTPDNVFQLGIAGC